MGEKSVILEECNAQSLQVKQVTPDLFHFVSSRSPSNDDGLLFQVIFQSERKKVT